MSPPALGRQVGLLGAVALGLGAMMGTGVYVSLALAAATVGHGVLVALGLAASLALANGLSSASLAAAHPVSGGTYAYARRFVSERVGFFAGALFLLAKTASAGTAALGASAYALALAGWEGQPAWPGAVLLVVAATGVVAAGVRRTIAVNGAIVAVGLGALAVFVGTSGLRADGWGALPARALADAGAALADGRLLPATALLFVAYTGYGRVATLGEEVVAPARTIPRAIVASVAVTACVYGAVAAAALAGAGARFGASAEAPLVAVAVGLGAPAVGGVLAVGALVGMVGVLLNLVLGLSRVAFAMVRDGELPTGLAGLRAGEPVAAVVAVGVAVGAVALADDVRWSWSLSAAAVLLYYALTHVAALRMPAAQLRVPRGVAWVGLAGCAGLALAVAPSVWGVLLGVLGFAVAMRALVARAGAAANG